MTVSSKTTSVGRNLTLSLVLLLTFVITSTALVMGFIRHTADEKNLEKKADELLTSIVKSIEISIWDFNQQAVEKISEVYFLSEDVSQLSIMDTYMDQMIIDKKKPDDSDLLYREASIIHRGVHIATVKMGLTKRFNKARLKGLFYSYVATTIIITIILIVMTDYLLKIFLKNPFNNLIFGMELVSQGNYGYDFSNAPREREFRAIVSQFKNMAVKIEKREYSLSRAKNYISVVFDSMDSMIVGVDSKLKLTHLNRAAREFIGMAMDEALEEDFVDIFPQFMDTYRTIWNAVEKQISRLDFRLNFEKAGEPTYFSVSVLPISFEGDNGAVVRIDDITERVRLEDMMIQTEKMLSVGGLAAGMAHEINNPLAGILQSMQVIENRISMPDMPANIKAADTCGLSMDVIVEYMEARKMPDLFNSVKEAGQRAAALVENMLSFSRKSNSGVVLCNLVTIIDDALVLAANTYDLRHKYDFKNIKVIRDFQEEMPAVPCDSIKMQQVIFNIFKNGAQAMAANDASAAPPVFTIRLGQREQEPEMELRIEDNGPGMDEETRKQIFEPFFTTKPLGVGTGLGLSVAYFIITEIHRGTMAVESNPGSGSAFVICLPLKKPDNRQPWNSVHTI